MKEKYLNSNNTDKKPENNKNQKRKSIIFILIILLVFFSFIFIYRFFIKTPSHLILLGTGNPGELRILANKIFTQWPNFLFQKKLINTGYKFVHSVSAGDIYNNGDKKIVAGISNSFYQKPYGCKVMIYNKDGKEPQVLDEIPELRCRDISIGDAYNIGKNSIVLGTHGQGLINVYTWDSAKGKWRKDELDKNYIDKIDQQENTDHRATKETTFQSFTTFQDSDYPGLIQTAVNEVKIGDIYQTGKNVVVATISSPLEYGKTKEISFIKSYQWTNNHWEERIIDQIEGQQFRSIAIGKIKDGKNSLIVGTGSMFGNNAKVMFYEWSNTANMFYEGYVYEGQAEENMTGLDIIDIDGDRQDEIILGASKPNSTIKILKWNEAKYSFVPLYIDNINKTLNLSDEFGTNVVLTNSADLDNDSKSELIVSGLIYRPGKNRWEETDQGFLIIYKNIKGEWRKKVIGNLPPVFALDKIRL